MERAFKGYEKGVYYQGNKVNTEYEPSDRLAEFILKANKPEKYRETGLNINMGNNSLVTILSVYQGLALKHKGNRLDRAKGRWQIRGVIH